LSQESWCRAGRNAAPTQAGLRANGQNNFSSGGQENETGVRADTFDFRLLFAYPFAFMGDEKSKNALLVSACVIAAVRLAREEIKPSPKVVATIDDSIRLAEMVLKQLERRNPST
jgi:hypothetical protein